MAHIELKNIRKAFGAVEVIKGVDLEVRSGEFMVFVGPSGCGKSTLLRLMAGLEDITSGEMIFDGQLVNALTPSKRGIAMVFQSYALYPHMTVYENMAFGMQLAKAGKDAIRERVERAAEMLQLTPYLARLPRQLSGGQRQRVAIGRAIVREPKIFLFDEPLSNLDAALRSEMRIELMELHKRLGSTMIYVTHDQIEAMTMADKIVVLNAGEISQVGTPLELYHKPDNMFVAGFIGSPKMNFINGRVRTADGSRVVVDLGGGLGSLSLPRTSTDIAGKEVTIGIRPEHLELGGGEFTLTVTPKIVEHLGIHTVSYSDLPGGEPFIGLFEGDPNVPEAQPLQIGFSLGQVHLFDSRGLAVY